MGNHFTANEAFG